MANKRHTPFGYEIISGEVKVSKTESEIVNLIYDLADKRYQRCDDGSKGRAGKRITEYLKNQSESKEINLELVKNITDKIIVQTDGDFYILLKNGQEIR